MFLSPLASWLLGLDAVWLRVYTNKVVVGTVQYCFESRE